MKPTQAHLQEEAGRCADPAAILRVARGFGLKALDDASISDARALAHSLLGDQVAPAVAFVAVQQRFPAAVMGFVEDGVITGVLSAFPLNATGLERIERGAFDAFNLDLALVTSPGEHPSAYYGWGFAARTKEAGRAVVKASVEIQRQLYWATPCFARAVSADGVRALTSIGFRRHAGADPSLLWMAPARTPNSGGPSL